jgi:carboxyl-terminal processing protease
MRPSLLLLLATALVLPAAASPTPTAAQSAPACPAPSAVPEQTPDAPLLMPEQSRLDLFDAVWGAINDGYLDPSFNGVDWAAIGDEYAPYFLQTENAWEVYDLVEEMVGLLGDDDVQFAGPLFMESLPAVETNYIGIGTLLDTRDIATDTFTPRVLYVYPGSGAEAAGIRPRDRIVSVDGDPCVSIPAVRGPEGTTVTLGVESPGEPVRDVVVERHKIDQRTLPISSRMGPDDSIGYLRLASIEGDAMTEGLVTTMAGFAEGDPIEGLILDLRSTNVGTLPVALALLGHLMGGTPGTLYSRTETSPLVLPDSGSRAVLSEVPIAVLVDDRSAGDAERVAMMLQAGGRAKVLGQETLGRTRGLTNLPFPDGSLLQLVTVGLELPDGTRPGKAGVKPDVPVEGDWLSYPEAEDPWIVAALDLLESPARPAASSGPVASSGPAASAAPTASSAPTSSASPAATASPATSPAVSLAPDSPRTSPAPSASPAPTSGS